ncbi:lipase family protein, partial [Mycolicibacterium fortuitum]|uniref:lipase family protein n=1 Tax=Mycolicibacterium fortuitum TaxID=1766 RepID=UPI000AE3345F
MKKSFAAVILFTCGFLTAPSAVAAAPDWSGLDARHYDAPIPVAGTLIETVPLDPVLSVPGAAQAYRILYSTVDQHDSPAVSTAAVFIPHGAPPEGGWPTIAWAHGTVGLGDDCAPSAQPRSARDVEYLTHWLDQGYAVVGSDYAGLGTPGLMSYLNSVATAHSVVDSVIAMHHMDLPLSPKWALVGQSQGGGAAVNSARWATEFSRGTGLDYRGVVATGTPFNVEGIVKQAGPDMALPPSLGPAANSYTGYILAGLREARRTEVVGRRHPGELLVQLRLAQHLRLGDRVQSGRGEHAVDVERRPRLTQPGQDVTRVAVGGRPETRRQC